MKSNLLKDIETLDNKLHCYNFVNFWIRTICEEIDSNIICEVGKCMKIIEYDNDINRAKESLVLSYFKDDNSSVIDDKKNMLRILINDRVLRYLYGKDSIE